MKTATNVKKRNKKEKNLSKTKLFKSIKLSIQESFLIVERGLFQGQILIYT